MAVYTNLIGNGLLDSGGGGDTASQDYCVMTVSADFVLGRYAAGEAEYTYPTLERLAGSGTSVTVGSGAGHQGFRITQKGVYVVDSILSMYKAGGGDIDPTLMIMHNWGVASGITPSPIGFATPSTGYVTMVNMDNTGAAPNIYPSPLTCYRLIYIVNTMTGSQTNTIFPFLYSSWDTTNNSIVIRGKGTYAYYSGYICTRIGDYNA